MSQTAAPLRSSGNGADKAAKGRIFRHEARKEGRVVAALEGTTQADGSVVVETTVTPAGRKPGDAITRAFPFPQVEAARRFAAETILALEYLGCDVN